jgi:hypothetical protein
MMKQCSYLLYQERQGLVKDNKEACVPEVT